MNRFFDILAEYKISKPIFFFIVAGIGFLFVLFLSQPDVEQKVNDINAIYIKEKNISEFESKIAAYEANMKEHGTSVRTVPKTSPFKTSNDIKQEDSLNQRIIKQRNQTLEHLSTSVSEVYETNKSTLNTTVQPTASITTDNQFINVKEKIDRRNTKSSQKSEQRDPDKESATPPTNHLQDNLATPQITESIDNLIQAVIHKTQIVKKGQTVMLRLGQSVTVNKITIPRNTIINGVVSFGENRLNISIVSIRINSNIIPVNISAYGGDGLVGLPVQINEVNKTVTDEITNETTRSIDQALSKFGAIGSIAGDIVSATSRTTQRQKDIQVKLIDNQAVFLKLN